MLASEVDQLIAGELFAELNPRVKLQVQFITNTLYCSFAVSYNNFIWYSIN